MAALRFESPLVWPEWLPSTPRASQRRDHGLATQITLTESINFLEMEIQELGASAVMFTDIEQPTIERLRKKVGSRTGASLQMRYHDKTYVFACDRWTTLEHNIYVMHLAIRQWRNIERWGIGSMDVLIKGFASNIDVVSAAVLDKTMPEWMHALGLGPTSTLDDAIAVYHRRAKQVAHDSEALSKLNILMEEVRAYFAARML